jgi:hypothetical protein
MATSKRHTRDRAKPAGFPLTPRALAGSTSAGAGAGGDDLEGVDFLVEDVRDEGDEGAAPRGKKGSKGRNKRKLEAGAWDDPDGMAEQPAPKRPAKKPVGLKVVKF